MLLLHCNTAQFIVMQKMMKNASIFTNENGYNSFLNAYYVFHTLIPLSISSRT
jgi:hypothetical protein